MKRDYSKRDLKKIWQRDKNNPKYKLRRNKFRMNLRKKVISHYSNGENKCACCNENNFVFLCLDHILGGGNEHRNKINLKNIYPWIKKNNFPPGFQILCWNCNFAKSHLGKCPHML